MRSDTSTPPGSRSSSTARPRAASASRERAGERRLAGAVEPLDRDQPAARHAADGSASGPYDGRRGDVPTTRCELPGIDAHPHARAVLAPALRAGGAPSHAYLFHGPPGTGKRAVARAFAAALLADGAQDAAELLSVRERIARGSHPDLTWVTPLGRGGDARRGHRGAGRRGGDAHAVRVRAAGVRDRAASRR